MSANKSLGQHFLIDRRAVARIVRLLDPQVNEPLLEIGPGRGALTMELLRVMSRVAAVELDGTLVERLRTRFDPGRLELFATDVLGLDLGDVLAALAAPSDARLVVVGNLPYNISKPVVQKLIRDRARVDRAVLMFQREVADRLTALPGRRSYGPLGILAGVCFRITRAFDLPARAFAPPPKVVSTVTCWQRLAGAPLGQEREQRLRAVLASCFRSRRRTLRNNLRAALGDANRVERLLDAAGVAGGMRAEQLDTAAFLRLADLWERDALI